MAESDYIIPENYLSVYSPLVYGIVSRAVTSADITVRNLDNGQVLAQRRLRGIPSPQTDIAGIVRNALSVRPRLYSTGFYNTKERQCRISVEINGIKMPERTFFTIDGRDPKPRIVSDPERVHRAMRGDRVEWLLFGDRFVSDIMIYVKGKHVSNSSASSQKLGVNRLQVFSLDTSLTRRDADRIDVRFITPEGNLDTCTVLLSPPSNAGMLLAWSNRNGDIERYRFPFCQTLPQHIERKTICDLEGCGHTVEMVCAPQWRLRSEYCAEWLLAAAERIRSARRVWIVDRTAFTPVRLVSDECAKDDDGLPYVEVVIEGARQRKGEPWNL